MNTKHTLADTARPWWRALTLLGLAPLLGALAQTSTVTVQHDQYLPEDPIVISFAGGPGNKKDWIGVYPDGEIPDGNPGSTIWNYVDGTQAGNTGFTEGSILFGTGLNSAGAWKAFLLKNDGYEILAETAFTVLEPGSPLVHVDKRIYQPAEAISVTFTNGPANAKDWVGIYPAGEVPDGNPPSAIWIYADGSSGGAAGVAAGTVTFVGGLTVPGNYVAYLLRDDGYEQIASESFTVAAPTTHQPRLLSISPANNTANLPPSWAFGASITNGDTKVVLSSVKLLLDGAAVAASATVTDGLVSVGYLHPSLLASGSTHNYRLTFRDDATPANEFTFEGSFSIGTWQDVVLPAPLYLETFDTTEEGQLPAGWTVKSYSAVENPEFDLGNLDSASYANWVVVNVSRFEGSFVAYSNPDNPEDDYHRVLTGNPFNVVNGQVVNGPLASGRMIFGDSGYRNGASQVLFLYSPDFNLTGKTNVNLVFHSLWEQNQDSIAAVEYSVDSGANWLPVAYFLDGPDILRTEAGEVDVEATFNTEYAGNEAVARYVDENSAELGGTYGAFVAAPITPALAPFIQARVDNDDSGSKRVEKFRLPQADNQAKVRLRFAHAGSDSWYWGLDNVGLYSIAGTVQPALLSIALDGDFITITSNRAGTLEVTDSLANPQWRPIGNGISSTIRIAADAQFFRMQ